MPLWCNGIAQGFSKPLVGVRIPVGVHICLCSVTDSTVVFETTSLGSNPNMSTKYKCSRSILVSAVVLYTTEEGSIPSESTKRMGSIKVMLLTVNQKNGGSIPSLYAKEEC